MGGRVKALLEIEGQPILDRQRAVLAPLVADLAVSGDPLVFAGCGLPTLSDEVSEQGPLAGIAAAMSWSRAPWLLVVAADMPYLSRTTIALLLAHRRGEIDAVAPRIRGLPEPLFALYSQRCRGALLRRLARGDYKASGILTDEGLRVAWLSEDGLRAVDPGLRCLMNVNSLADLGAQED
jgi:molybdopterin-guanine dinucleotide biosynthesis protein A